MYVPPFIPQQIEIPSNAAQAPYLVRLGFIRRVVGSHAVSVALLIGLSYLPNMLSLTESALLTIGSLLLLSLIRGLVKGKRYEQALSALVAPLLFLGLSQLIGFGPERGWPQWLIGLGPLGLLAYTLACGRDLSFLGMYILTSLFVILAMVGLLFFGAFSTAVVLEAGAISLAFIAFFVYDLAALLTRRRLGEEIGAVLDLYRDALNFTTYTVRVIRHWRKHRIWSLK
jgi:hypothetical protein